MRRSRLTGVEGSTQTLQVGNQRIHFGLALELFRGAFHLLFGIGHANNREGTHVLFDGAGIGRTVQPGESRHVRLGNDIARIVQMHAVPFIRIASTDTCQIRTGALGAPLERVVVDELAGDRVVAVAFGFGAERTDHLRVAVVAAFADVDVAPRQLQRGVGLQAFHRLRRRALEEQRNDLDQSTHRDGEQDQHDHQEVVGLDRFVRQTGAFVVGHVVVLLRRGPQQPGC